MLITLLITCCLISGIQSHQTRGHYTVVAPGTIRSNSEYHVSITLDDFNQSCWFNITLEAYSGNNDEIVTVATVEVEPNTTKLVKIQLPKLYYGYGTLSVFSYRGIIRAEKSRINIEERQYSLYIQTDKGKYQPGEAVQFRLIFIDRLTLPAQVDEVIDVCIYDGQSNLIRQFSDVKLIQGVFRSEFQLSHHPVLGEWNLEVRVGGVILQENDFEVARYTLPKFSVEIDTKKNVAVDEGKILLKVSSSYTYDELVVGNLTISLKSIYATIGKSSITKVTKEFNGTTVIGLDIENDLGISANAFLQYSQRSYSYSITATVTEESTGEIQSDNTRVAIHGRPYKIQVDAPSTFQNADFIKITVLVTDLEGSPYRDTMNYINVTVDCTSLDYSKLFSKIDFENVGMPVTLEGSAYLNEVGIGVVTFELPNVDAISQYQVTARYLDYETNPISMEKKYVGTFNLDVLTEVGEIGKQILIKLKSTDPIDYFTYEVISRGDIIETKRITVPGNKTTYLLSLNATYSMVPKITLFVHRAKKGILDSYFKDIYIKRAFRNSINITTEDEVLPGALVSLNVTTDEGSYVGLMGVDERLLVGMDDKSSLSEDMVYTELRNYESINLDSEPFPGAKAGLVTFSNTRNRAGLDIGISYFLTFGAGFLVPTPERFDKPYVELPRIRRVFSESWMFRDFERTPAEGLRVRETIPDTITSWAITGFSLNPNTGLTLTKNATKVRVFKKNFISMELPSSAKAGETIEVPFYVHNYMDLDLRIIIRTVNVEEGIKLMKSLHPDSIIPSTLIWKTSISVNENKKFKFFISLQQQGTYNVTIEVISPLETDAIQRTFVVDPEGTPFSISKTYLVNNIEDSTMNRSEILVEIPENVVPGSERIQLSVVGDFFGPLMRSLQNLVRVPYGNSENNMKYFVSNLLVLKYLKSFNYSKPSLESKAKLHLELGYQTQLGFKHLDGSFSLFDRTVERSGDTWLTAYIVWALQQAREFIQVDMKVIERGLNFLKKKQTERGGFNSAKGVEEDATLTSFAILAFLVGEKSQSQYQNVTLKGLTYLYDILDDLKEPASAAISTYVLVLGKHGKSKELLAKLSTQAALKSKELELAKPDNLESNLETTTYSFMSLLESEDLSFQSLLPILRSLISVGQLKRTHAHMVALEGLIKFAHRIDFRATNLNIRFEDDQGESGDLRISPGNAQLYQMRELKRTSRHIKLQTTGKGFALISVNYRYNRPPENQTSSNFETNITSTELTDRSLSLNICTALRPSGNRSDLIVMEVQLPSGYKVYDSFDRIKENNEHVKSIEIEEGDQAVRLYLENVSQNGTCIKLDALKAITVFNLKPISVKVYDASDEQQRSIMYHKYNSNL